MSFPKMPEFTMELLQSHLYPATLAIQSSQFD